MKSGVLFLVEKDTKLTSTQTSVTLPETNKFDELTEAIDVRQTINLSSSATDAQKGKIAAERVVQNDNIRINDDGISELTTEKKEAMSTDFLYHPGEFFALSNSDGQFAFDVVNRIGETNILSSVIDLDRFITTKLESKVDVNPWKIGFYNKQGPADNGVVHGDALLNDNELASVLDVTEKNQLGVDYEYNSQFIRMTAAESGYVEIYRPNDFETSDFCEYISKEILPAMVPE